MVIISRNSFDFEFLKIYLLDMIAIAIAIAIE